MTFYRSEGNYIHGPLSLSYPLHPRISIRAYFSGRLIVSLVREFLTFLKLDCTLSVFEAEAIEGRSLQVLKCLMALL